MPDPRDLSEELRIANQHAAWSREATENAQRACADLMERCEQAEYELQKARQQHERDWKLIDANHNLAVYFERRSRDMQSAWAELAAVLELKGYGPSGKSLRERVLRVTNAMGETLETNPWRSPTRDRVSGWHRELCYVIHDGLRDAESEVPR